MPDRSGQGRQVPATDRGKEARAALIVAAQAMFAASTYDRVSVAAIVRHAGLAHGSFYTYFSSKEDIFRAVMQSVRQDFIREREHSDRIPPPDARSRQDFIDAIRQGNKEQLLSYGRHAPLLRALEEAAAAEPAFRPLRLETREAFLRAIEERIRLLQNLGFAAQDIDPHYSAHALGGMVERFAYVWAVLGESYDLDAAVETLTTLWVRAIGLEDGLAGRDEHRDGDGHQVLVVTSPRDQHVDTNQSQGDSAAHPS